MKKGALKILTTLHEHGFTALFVGGCVRDMLMGIPVGDYDIVTDASPQQIMRLFKHTVPVGTQFGIVIVVMKGVRYEVAQFRGVTSQAIQKGQNSPYLPYLQKDACLRDFTINGMFYDPFTKEIFDYVGGQRDIAQKIIRGIGNPHDRLQEDKLRMMRAIRFAISFGYQIDPETFEAICQLAPRITEVSMERIRDELLKILTVPHPDRSIRLLDETHLLKQILPEITALKGVPQPEIFHPEGDVFTHTLLMLQQLHAPSPELALAVLLHDVGKSETFTNTDRIRFHRHASVGAQIAENICERLKFSTKATEKIVTLVKEHLKCFDVEKMKKSSLKRFLRQEYIKDLLELHRLDCLSSNRDLRTYQFCLAKLDEFSQESIHPPRLISGNDLIELGFTPGPIFSQVLEYLEDAQLEGKITTKQEALTLAKEFQETLAAEVDGT